MTTMELNLRKESLKDYIQAMDEEAISKVEKYIRKLYKPQTVTDKAEPKPYPWAPDEEELRSIVAESEENYRNGKYIEEEEMTIYLNSLK